MFVSMQPEQNIDFLTSKDSVLLTNSFFNFRKLIYWSGTTCWDIKI